MTSTIEVVAVWHAVARVEGMEGIMTSSATTETPVSKVITLTMVVVVLVWILVVVAGVGR